MNDKYYKGYWMITNRCNLSCSYCVLENAPHQKALELTLENKKQFITHLYEKLNFRQLTLSGGEVSIIGKQPPRDFIALLYQIKQFRSSDPKKNLGIEVYTNGIYITEEVIDAMQGVVDVVAMTIDSTNNTLLSDIGRRYRGKESYYEHIVQLSHQLAAVNIDFKLHSVISQKNHLCLPDEVEEIVKSIKNNTGKIADWKFYQYMSYDMPQKDNLHAIPTTAFQAFKEKTEKILKPYAIRLHFKNNNEMNASLFNILSYGNAQYMRADDTWSTSQRTRDLRSYHSMQELFMQHDIDVERFHAFHELKI